MITGLIGATADKKRIENFEIQKILKREIEQHLQYDSVMELIQETEFLFHDIGHWNDVRCENITKGSRKIGFFISEERHGGGKRTSCFILEYKRLYTEDGFKAGFGITSAFLVV